jgi:Helicase conserved C-terminal domain
VVGLPTTVDALAAAAGPRLAPERLRAGLRALAELGIAVAGPDGAVAGPPRLAAAFGRPGRLGPPVAELAKVGVSADQLARVLANLAPAGAAPPRNAVEPAGGKAALVRAVSAALADPEVVRRALAGAGAEALRLLDEALAAPGPVTVLGVGYGRFAGYPDAEPASWLLERGLLMPVTYNQLAVPREAALGLRGGLVFPEWPDPPRAEPLDPVPDGPALAAAAATRAVVAAEGICTRLDRQPLPLVRAGTLAVRDLRRLAGELDLPEDELALLVDLLVEAGVLGVGGPFEQRSLGLRPEADAWLAGPRPARWADLAVAWRDAGLALEDHLAARHGLAPAGADRARPLDGRRQAAAAARRRGLLQALVGLPPGRSITLDGLAALLAWRQPLAWPTPPPSARPAADARQAGPAAATAGLPGAAAAPGARQAGPPAAAGGRRQAGPAGAVRAVLDAAAFLGLAATGGGRAQPGLAADALVAGAGAAELAGEAARSLPDGGDRLLVAGDLTVVAPRGLAPAVEARLAALADRETAGASATWRVSEASLRRAFDEGRSAGEVLDFLRRHSDTPLPQALEYLVGDAARRHGRLRVGGAATYLRGDPALVAGAVRSPAGRRLGLRELAPGVAVTSRPEAELLAALRKAGEAPLAEEPDGSPRPESPRPVRHAQRTAGQRPAGERAGGATPAGATPAAANGHAQRPPAEHAPPRPAEAEDEPPAAAPAPADASATGAADAAGVVARLRGRQAAAQPAGAGPARPAAEGSVRG